MSSSSQAPVYAEVVARSRTGASLFHDTPRLVSRSLFAYQSDAEGVEALSARLTAAGFTVIATSAFGVSITGPRKLYNDYFKARIGERPVQMYFGAGHSIETTAFFMDERPNPPPEIANLAETVYVPRRGYFLAGEGAMPTPAYYHLRPPADIARLTRADQAHARNYRGTGVKVAMIDSGFILNHDYYANKGYHITVQAAVGDSNSDEYGHGTGIAANLLAIAPDCDFHFVKMSDGQQWASLAAFRLAVQAGVKVITCSWGQWRDPVLEAEIVAAVAAGVTVIFACGNGGSVGWPGCMPDVISVGGAFPRQDGSWEASSYASSGVNQLYPNRHCPDLSAIVGQAPNGIFIVMPTMAGAEFDASFANGGAFPNGDETGPADGWLVASGTSSAAPMVAGAAALLLQAKPGLTPAEIKQTLSETCQDVNQGSSASGEASGVGPDSATGAGMIDVGAAVLAVAPVLICPTAPIIKCPPAPIIKCPPAPIIKCPPSPVVGCVSGAIRERPVPIEDQVGQPAEVRYVPVVVLMEEQQAYAALSQEEQVDIAATAHAAATAAYYATLAEFGLADEYMGFPEGEGPSDEPFNPQITR